LIDLKETSPTATVEHSQTIGDGVILTSIYKKGALSKYQLFMRNTDGTCEVVGLNPDLATETAFPLRQNFDEFAENVGEDTVITTEGNGNKRQVKRFDLVDKPDSQPSHKAKESQCVITKKKVDGKVVDTQQEGDCGEDS
jgi:ribosomal protein L3